MDGNATDSKRKSILSLARNAEDDLLYVSLSVNDKILRFPLTWLVFGSVSSLDCDVIVWVPLEFTEMGSGSHVPNIICEVLDELLGPIIGTEKEVNSSIGYWAEGELKWAQKGSDLGEVNNSIMATFDNHPKLQMLEVCPLTKRLERNVWSKIMTTIRDILCKMNKSRYINRSKENNSENMGLMHDLLTGVLNIPEIHSLPLNEKKRYVYPLLQGVFIQPTICDELCKLFDYEEDLVLSIKTITVSFDQKKIRMDAMNKVISSMEKDESFASALTTVLVSNGASEHRLDKILKALEGVKTKSDDYTRLRKILLDAKDSGVIRLNRIIRIVRRMQPLGIRIDCLRLLNLEDITYLLDAEGLASRYKDIAFKVAQAWSLMGYDNNPKVELYDKEEISKIYPEFAVFLWRKKPSSGDLSNFTGFIRRFLDKVEAYSGYDRALCESDR